MPEKLSFGDMEGEDLATTVLTCEGDITDPAFPFKLQLLVTKLQHLISDEEKPIQVTKVEPWNSVRVTFNIPLEAAQRLRQLAERGDQVLRELGILSVQIEGDQVITLTLAGQFNEPQEIVLRKTTEDQNEVASLTFNLPSSEPVPGPSSAEPAHKNISQFLGHIVGGAAATASAVACSSTRVELPDHNVKTEPSVTFRSPNVIAPSNTDPIPFPPTSLHPTVPSSPLLRSPASTTPKSQPTFGPFPFASMTHAMHTKHSSSSSQYQAVHKSSTSPRLPFTATTTSLLTTPSAVRTSAFTNPNLALSITRPQNASSPTLQKSSRPVSSPVFNNIVSRGAAPNSVVPVSRANVALSSPLLVNLLQSETSNLQGHNKLMPPPAIAANQAVKRKRKPRKPKEKTTEDGNSVGFSSLPSPPLPHIGLRSPVGLDAIGNLGQPFNMPMSNIPLSPPTSQLSSLHHVSKAQVSGSAMQAQTANIHPQAQGQPPVSLHPASVQGQLPLSSSRLIQGPSAMSALRRQSLVHHTPVPNIHPQAQGQPQVHTGNLPLHTHIPVGSPQLARPPPNSLPSYAMSVARGVAMNTNRMLFANRDSSLIAKHIERSNKDTSDAKPSYKSSAASSTPCNSTPESNPFPSPPSSSDGKTKHLINPFTGQLESASDDEEEDESLGSLPPFPDFEIDNSENGQSERSLSDGGKENNLSSDTDSGISKSHTDISQSSSEGASADSVRDQKKPEIVARAETVSSATVTSSVPGEKLKLRLKIDPKTIRESKDAEIREKKSKEGSNVAVVQKPDAGTTCISGVKKGAAVAGSATNAPEPRVPPLHISLRGPNSAVVVSPRKEETKTKHSLGKDRSPRSSRTSESFGSGACGTARLFDSERRMKSGGARDCKKEKDNHWNQNMKNMSGGGIVEMSEKLNLSHASNYETYLPHVTVPAGAMQRKPTVRDSCKSDVITLTSCATGESVSIHTAASSRSPLPFHLMVGPENENVVAVSPQPSQERNSSVQAVTSLPERTSKNTLVSSRNHVQEPSDSFSDRKKEASSVLGSRKSTQFMQKGHLPHSPNMQMDSRNSVQKASRSSNPHPPTSANCVPITSTVPPVSTHSVSVVSASQCFARSATPVVTSTADPGISGISDASTPFLKRKNVSKSHVDGISPLTSEKSQVSNQCNTLSSSARPDVSESTVSKTVQNEKTFSNSYSDTLYTKDKVLIKEVQMKTSVNRDPTANSYDVSTNDVNCSNDGKVIADSSVDNAVKQPFVEKDTEHKDSVFNNIIDRCKSPLASIVSVTKREIIQDAMDTSEKGLRVIEIKKPPIAQIITVDSIPIQSRVIEVPSLPSSLSVPNSIVKSDLAIEVSSIPSLIPSHGGVFLPPRNTLVLQECRSTSLVNDRGRDSPEFSQPKVTNSCLDSFPNSRLLSPESESERRPGSSDGNAEAKIKGEEDSNEHGSSTNPSEESSMDSIDEERKRCMLVSEVRTSTPGPPNDVKSKESETSNCLRSHSSGEIEKDISKSGLSTHAMLDAKSVSHQVDDHAPKQTSSSQDDSLVTSLKDALGVDTSISNEKQLSPSALPALIPATEKNNKNDSACDNAMQQSRNSNPSRSTAETDKPFNKPSDIVSVVDLVPTQTLPIESRPLERTTTTSVPTPKFEDSDITANAITATTYSTPSSQPVRCNPVCEPISVVCSSSNSVVSSLLSQGRFLPSDVSSAGRVKLIFKGGNPHSMLTSCNSPTSMVLPLNASKTVPIKLVTLPGGSAGLSVRSTSNPNVVEIIGQKPPSAHVSSSSGSRQVSSPVRLVVSKVAPSVSCSNQSGTSSLRNRVVVKSVVVTGTGSPIKLVSAMTTSICSAPTVTVTSATPVLSLSEKLVSTLTSSTSVLSTPQLVQKPKEETELGNSSELFDNSKTDLKRNSSELSDNTQCHSPFQSVSNNPDITMISSSPEVSISSLSSSSSCSAPSMNVDETTQNKLKSTDETSESKSLLTLDNSTSNIEESKTETSLLENLLNENFSTTETNNKVESNQRNLIEEVLECANVSNADPLFSKEEISGAKEIVKNTSKTVSPSLNLSTMPEVSSVDHCTNSPDLTIDDTCLLAPEITVGSEVQISSEDSEQCTDKIAVNLVPKRNTDNCHDVVVDQPFLLNSVQNDLCISPQLVIKSEDIIDKDDLSDKVKVDKHLIRPFKEPKMECKANPSGTNICDGEQNDLKDTEKCPLAATLVYSKPVKRKCSENAAELIKACMGVEDGPKRGLILKPKEEVTEKMEPVEKVEDDAGRMSLRVRRDDATKKCKDCSSDEELALSELISKVRTRERPTRVRPYSRDTPTDLVNCRPGRRRSGSNESQKSDEIKTRTRDCKRESKKEETVKKMPERTKRSVLKAQGVQRNVHIKDNDLKQSVINIKEETNVKRKTRSTGNTETAVEVVPGKRRRYSKDGHR